MLGLFGYVKPGKLPDKICGGNIGFMKMESVCIVVPIMKEKPIGETVSRHYTIL